ncbi:MAG: hypothetical protein H6823_08370 [Planctomycetaceae bacterium]|nr:hypothetical protein [Planctomycetaceae bacterium]
MSANRNRWLLLMSIALSLVVGVSNAQQRLEGRGRLAGGGPSGFGGGGPLDLLQRSDVQSELELLDEQKAALSKSVTKFNERRREVLMGFADQFRNRDAASVADREALRDQVQEAFRTLNKEGEEGLTFLLPHQRRRLSQLELQFRMRGAGGLGPLGSNEVGEQLSVTDEQREALRTKAIELGQEFGKKVAELRREMQVKLLAELKPDQRMKFREMLGDPFEFQDRPSSSGGERENGSEP